MPQVIVISGGLPTPNYAAMIDGIIYPKFDDEIPEAFEFRTRAIAAASAAKTIVYGGLPLLPGACTIMTRFGEATVCPAVASDAEGGARARCLPPRSFRGDCRS
jgi:hypothetical protein